MIMLPIWLYGSHTCEDTAVTRDRLNALQIRFIERDKEDDERIIALLGKYNQGMARTPTLVFGDDEIVIAEPTLEQLQEALIRAGYTFDEPVLKKFDAKRYLPDINLQAVRSAQTQSSITILFFAHSPACRVCQGYAKQIAAQSNRLAESGARLQIVLRAGLDEAKKWAKEFAPGADVLVDDAGEFKREAANLFPDTWDIRSGGTWLWWVNAEDVIKAGVYAPDAGGLAAPSEILRFQSEKNI